MKYAAKIFFIVLCMSHNSCIGFLGKQIDEKSSRYRKTPFGIVFASFDEASTDKWLKDVDEATFEVLSESDARDKNRYWHYGTEITGANPKTLVFIDIDLAKDDKTIFDQYEGMEWRKWTCGVDGKTAELVVSEPAGFIYSYLRDKNAIYYLNTRLEADPATFRQFTVIGGIFVDSHNAFFNGEIVDCIDVPTMILCENGEDFEDKNNFYKYDGDFKYKESEGIIHLPYTIIPKQE